MKYRSEIDGLRALAVLPVIFFHAGFQVFSGGYVGVDVFFVISGYLITTIIASELETGTFSLAAFYERRARRILPALFFVMLVSLPFAMLWLLPREMKDYAKSLVAVPLFISNVLFWRQSGYFDTGIDAKPLIHTWSLAVEEQFYVLFPLLLGAAWGYGRRRVTATMAIIGVFSLAMAQVFSKTHPDATFYLLHTRAWELIMGALAALYLMRKQPATVHKTVAECASAGGVLMIAAAVFLFGKATPFPSVYALLPTVGAALIIMFANPGTLAGRLLGCRPMLGLGLISYSAYLWHQPVFVFARAGYSIKNGGGTFAWLIALTLLLAYLTWYFIEQPLRNKLTFKRRSIVAASISCSALLLAVGVVGIRTGGGFYRYEPDAMAVLGNADERGKYVWNNANQIKLKDFDAARRKILIIGDSMGADVLNAVSETPYADKIAFSFYTIDYACGNLYLKQDFIDKIDPAQQQACRNVNWYANPKLQQLMKQADQVWLVSVWVPWHVERLDESLRNLKAEFGDKFFVISRKSFGKVPLQDLSVLSLSERRAYRMAPVDYVMGINTQLKAVVPADRYFDLSDVICPFNECRYFDESGQLLSYDGDHLTRSGARYVGQRLLKEPHFAHDLLGVP